MSYSVDSKTKIATYNGQQYYPKALSAKGITTLVAVTEDECKELKTTRDNAAAVQLQSLR